MKVGESGRAVKASALIAELQKGGHSAVVEDPGDLHPFLQDVFVEVDEESRVCTLKGVYAYHEDCAERGLDVGCSRATVLDVDFRRGILDMSDQEIEVDGIIEYDEGLTEEDVIAAAEDGIDFVDYDPDAFPFIESSASDSDIAEKLEYSLDDDLVIARGSDGRLYGYESKDDIPDGSRALSTAAAIEALAKERPDIVYMADWET